MVSRFEFATVQRIIFGQDTLLEAGLLTRKLGTRPLVVTGRNRSRCRVLLELLAAQGLSPVVLGLAGEPTVMDVRLGAAQARAKKVDVVVAFGGGSALDAGKAIAALAVNSGDPLQYLEVIGQGRALEHPPLPCIAIPTTAGTGSEVTRNAVLASPEHGVKVSLRHEAMLPRVALVDPNLTLDLPPEITASTGMDALTQLIEPFVCRKANPMTDVLCAEGVRRVAKSLHQAWENGQDQGAREDMAMASLLGGLALANAGLGAVHGLAAPLGGLHPVPHGVACAALLPPVMEANLGALYAQGSPSPLLGKFQELGRLLTGNPEAQAADGVCWVTALAEDLQIPRLREYGLDKRDLALIAERAQNASSMKANPVSFDSEALVAILAKAL